MLLSALHEQIEKSEILGPTALTLYWSGAAESSTRHALAFVVRPYPKFTGEG